MQNGKADRSSYANLTVQMLASGLVMYLVMFAMIDDTGGFYNNLNTLYMTMMMVAPMAALMIVAMPHMFASKRANAAILIGAALAFAGSFALIRTQATIGDRAFLRSMIPHHSGAILMCRQAKLTDPQILRLCSDIRESQQREIDEMKVILRRL